MKRILIKLSGEALNGKNDAVMHDKCLVDNVARVLTQCVNEGYEVAVVCGAGNICRGRDADDGVDRTAADRMGMLATVMNSIYLKDAITRAGGKACLLSAVPMMPFAEGYSAEAAISAMERGEVALLSAGLGIPFLSTDTAGVVRASEIGADAMLMAKNVDYVYEEDPDKNPDAKHYDTINASELVSAGLRVIDFTAAAFAISSGLPIRIFGLKTADDIIRAIRGDKDGTVILPK